MKALLELIMRRRIHAVLATVLLALATPLMSWLSSAVVALATLKQGQREGGVVIAGAVLVLGAVMLMLTGSPRLVLALLVVSWLPAWLLANLLNATRSQGVLLLGATGMGVAAVLAVHAGVWDISAALREQSDQLVATMKEQPSADPRAVANFAESMAMVSERAAQLVGMVTVLSVMLPMLVARWAHAVLDNPGGFGREFKELRVGRVALGVALVILLLAMLGGAEAGGLMSSLAGPAWMLLVFQGLAVAHGVVREKGAAVGWLVAIYALLILPPYLSVVALPVVALLDGWLDFRARAKRSSGPPSE